jgi:hypothetical protein
VRSANKATYVENSSQSAAPARILRRIHQIIVGVADRGPSTRALAIVAVAGLSIAVLSMLELPTMKRPPREWPTSTEAAAPPPSPDSVAADNRVAQEPPSSGVIPAAHADAAIKPPAVPRAPVVTAVAAPAPRIDMAPAPEPATPPRVANAPRVLDASHVEPLAVGATGRPPIDLIVAPAAPTLNREPSAALPVAARDEMPAPRPAAEPRPVADPEPRPAQTSERVSE